MALRITKVDEYQFLTCLKHKLWGSNSDRFKKWCIGDSLVFIVNKQLVGLAEISSEEYKSDEIVWDNGTYPFRINLKFLYILLPENRIPILGDIRDALINAWGASYGWGILNQTKVPQEVEKIITNSFKKQQNSLESYYNNIEYLLNDAKERRDNAEVNRQNHQFKRGRKKVLKIDIKEGSMNNQNELIASEVEQPKTDNMIDDDNKNDDETKEGTNHSKAQHLLITMGKITGCSVWVASNDRSRKYQGEALGETCAEYLPNFGLNKEAMDRIAFIDVIWIQQNAPICAFEVETTTSIYSGILRMSDLLSLVPALKIKLFIVAPKERKKKVMQELNRPTFKKIGLNEYCKFISIEDLEKLLNQIKDLYGDVRPTVVEKIAIEADNDKNY